MSFIRPVFAKLNAPTEPLGEYKELADVLGTVLNVVFYVGIALTVVFLIIGGIRYVTSGGSKEGSQAARSAITNAIIGFVVVVGAFAIRTIIANVLGTNAVVPTTPPF